MSEWPNAVHRLAVDLPDFAGHRRLEAEAGRRRDRERQPRRRSTAAKRCTRRVASSFARGMSRKSARGARKLDGELAEADDRAALATHLPVLNEGSIVERL